MPSRNEARQLRRLAGHKMVALSLILEHQPDNRAPHHAIAPLAREWVR